MSYLDFSFFLEYYNITLKPRKPNVNVKFVDNRLLMYVNSRSKLDFRTNLLVDYPGYDLFLYRVKLGLQ